MGYLQPITEILTVEFKGLSRSTYDQPGQFKDNLVCKIISGGLYQGLRSDHLFTLLVISREDMQIGHDLHKTSHNILRI